LGFESKAIKDYDRPIYLDMQATSPTDPRVLDAMIPYMTELYGNPHSRTHKYGWETEQAVERAREVRYDYIGFKYGLFFFLYQHLLCSMSLN
jgi:cysteine desulfurase